MLDARAKKIRRTFGSSWGKAKPALKARRAAAKRVLLRHVPRVQVFELLSVSAFAAFAVLFLLVWLSRFELGPEVVILFYLTPAGVALAAAEEIVFRRVVQKALGTIPQIFSYLAYAGFVATWFVHEGQVSFIASALPTALLATALAVRFGFPGALWFRIFFLGASAVTLVSVALAFSLLMVVAPLALVQVKRKSTSETLAALSLKWVGAKKTLYASAKLFALVFAALFVEGLVFNALGVLDSEKVAEMVRRQSLLGVAIAVTLAPVGEELFFRGYLQKRVGIFLTSLLFAWLHLGYGSMTEIIAAFTVSIILGLWLKKNDNVLPCIFTHALYNVFSITATHVLA